MAYDFPTSPAMDEVVTFPDGKSYVWNGTAWASSGNGSVPPGDYVLKAGDTMTGALYLPLPDPVLPEEAVNKQYVDNLGSTPSGDYVLKAGDTMTGPLYLPLPAPTLPEEAANKQYVDDNSGGGSGGVDQGYVDAADDLRVLKAGDEMTGNLEFADPVGLDYGGLTVAKPGRFNALTFTKKTADIQPAIYTPTYGYVFGLHDILDSGNLYQYGAMTFAGRPGQSSGILQPLKILSIGASSQVWCRIILNKKCGTGSTAGRETTLFELYMANAINIGDPAFAGQGSYVHISSGKWHTGLPGGIGSDKLSMFTRFNIHVDLVAVQVHISIESAGEEGTVDSLIAFYNAYPFTIDGGYISTVPVATIDIPETYSVTTGT